MPDRDRGRTVQISLRVRCDDWARLDALAARVPLGRSALAREALRIGVAAIDADPAAALVRAPP